MDELSALPPEGALKRSSRRSSLNPRYTYTNPSPATTTRAESPPRTAGGLQHRYSSLSVNTDASHNDVPVILAPTPRRHLIESSASQHWLNTPPPLSPNSTLSRALSPNQGVAFPASGSTTSITTGPSQSQGQGHTYTAKRRLSSSHRRSWSSAMLEHEMQAAAASGSGSGSTSTLRPSASGGVGARGKPPEPEEPAMVRRWIRWMHKRGIKQWVVPLILLASVLVKFAIGLGTYSGFSTPPMYGDYEAQRHWMELTVHLPFREWYTYDLQYWGLDYPPLTAYVSWICGIIAHRIDPSWVALDKSRGIETPESKVFMRSTVVVLDALIYVPALLLFAQTWQGSRSKRTQELAILTLLLQPALLLIDFGHFQYNSVMLGFTLLAMNFFATGQDLVGAFFFVLSLGFKQMALYYAPAIGSYLLARCLYLGPTEGARHFVNLGIVTASTFLLLFLPWLPPFASFTAILQPIRRIFPFARGLFEDKVANFWCASNVVFKWKAWASSGTLVKLSTLFTAVGFLPAVAGLIRAGVTMSAGDSAAAAKKNDDAPPAQETLKEPTPFLPLLPYALLTSSMSFFLFSFQVHEKTILLPLLPMTLLLSGAPIDSAAYSWGVLVNNIGVFSMWPLLKRDGLGVQYIATLLLWNRLIGHHPLNLRPKSFVQLLSMAVYAAAFALHLLELVIPPPARYPDIYPVLNVLISTPVFFLAWLWSIKCGVEVGWAVSGPIGTHSHHPSARPSGSEDAGGVAHESGSGSGFRQSGGRAASLGYKRRSQLPATMKSPVETTREDGLEDEGDKK